MAPDVGARSLAPDAFGPDAEPDPLDEPYLRYLFAKRHESPNWDFKSELSIAKGGDFGKVAKDVFAFGNHGGGYILIGWKKSSTGVHEPIGLRDDHSVDQASLQEKFNALSPTPITIGYTEFSREVEYLPDPANKKATGVEVRRFAAIFVPPFLDLLAPVKDVAYIGNKMALKKGMVYTRRGTQSVPASDEEIFALRERISHDRYRIALVSGKPDPVHETLHSNLFPILRLPTDAYSAELRVPTLPSDVRRRWACVPYAGRVYSFDDPRQTELKNYIMTSSVHRVNITKWRADPDRDRMFHWLLKEAIKCNAQERGMWAQHKGDRLFYPLRDDEKTRKIDWRGLTRGRPRRVAERHYAEGFEQDVYKHHAVGLEIVEFADKLFLQLVPTFVITWDGRRVIKDDRVGAVVTSLLHDKYNADYLRDMYFWVEQLETQKGRILLPEGFEISTTPLMATVDLGIVSDQMRILDDPGDDTPPEAEP
ncbi:MAG: hypothetical protein QOE90_3499 [Thermoplasmata archaeon]|jgi:hypothetical protein|nr:hypothetical protein [Thermoplasmata archaeon]